VAQKQRGSKMNEIETILNSVPFSMRVNFNQSTDEFVFVNAISADAEDGAFGSNAITVPWDFLDELKLAVDIAISYKKRVIQDGIDSLSAEKSQEGVGIPQEGAGWVRHITNKQTDITGQTVHVRAHARENPKSPNLKDFLSYCEMPATQSQFHGLTEKDFQDLWERWEIAEWKDTNGKFFGESWKQKLPWTLKDLLAKKQEPQKLSKEDEERKERTELADRIYARMGKEKQDELSRII